MIGGRVSAVLVEAPWCAPRFATPRTSRRTLGPAVGRVASMLGTPLMPWQQHVADVAFEVGDDGKLVYREIVLTVPRQSGKTTLLLAVAVHRALAVSQFGRRNKMIYTAQTRKDALEKLREDWVYGGLDTAKRLSGRYVFRESNGSEHVRFLDSGSKLAVESTTEKAGHGGTLDLAFLDEAFAQVDGRSEQAFGPAMITRPQPQLWVNSTAGWLGGSPYLWSKVEAGRARVLAGETRDIAYFEWSADPDANPEDPATWWSCMPALGHTITEPAVRVELNKMKTSPEGLNGFCRAYLNLWKPKDAPASQVIPNWAASKGPSSQINGDRFAFAFDMTPERSHGSIAVAGMDGDRTHLEVVDHTGLGGRTGVDWMVDRIVELDALGPVAWVVDAMSPAASLIQALEDKGITVTVTNVQDLVRACGNFFDAATNPVPSIVHLGQPELDAAIKAAKKRVIGDRFAWSRRDPLVPISPLMAVTLAAHGLATAPAPAVSLPPSRAPTVRVADSDVMTQPW